MRDRLGTVGWLLGALVVMGLLLFSGSGPPPPRPVTPEDGSYGLLAVAEWLRRSNVSVAVLRERYDALPEAAEGNGNLLIAHAPFRLYPERGELQALNRWIRNGNTLLAVAPFFETPAWIQVMPIGLQRDVHRLTGLMMVAETGSSGNQAFELHEQPGWVLINGGATTVSLVATDDDPLGDGLDNARVPWDLARWKPIKRNDDTPPAEAPEAESPTSNAEPEGPQITTPVDPATAAAIDSTASDDAASDLWEPVLQHAGSERVALWRRPMGDGHVLLLCHPSLLANVAIGQSDNHQFITNVVEQYVDAEKAVIFDDAHQGEDILYSGADLLLDSRLYASIGFLLLVWAVYMLADAGTWDRITTQRWRGRRGHADLVRTAGGFFARVLTTDAAARALVTPLREQLAQRWQLPITSALEQGLLREPGVEAEARELRRLLEASAAGRRVNLVRLHNLTVDISNRIAMRESASPSNTDTLEQTDSK